MLGQGGFGITYLATDISIQRQVAIKEFFPKDFCDRDSASGSITHGTQNNVEMIDKLQEKFIKEAMRLATLNNQNIVRIYTAFEENGTAYYVMDYIKGAPLSEIVAQNGPLPVEKALKFIKEVGNALIYLHKNKINHLDVKPANIMIDSRDNQAILIDFGISKQYDHQGNQTSTTPVGISHGYAPIEQYKSDGVVEFSPQTDIYSLAATLYYLLTGNVPPQAPSLINESLSFPVSVPYNIQMAISKAMNPQRNVRQRSVEQFLHELTAQSAATVVRPSARQPRPAAGSDVGYGYVNAPKPKANNSKMVIYASAGAFIIGCLIVWIIFALARGNDNSNADEVVYSAKTDVKASENLRSQPETAVAHVEEEPKVEAKATPVVEDTPTLWGSKGVRKKGYICYFFSGTFYHPDGKTFPFMLVFLEKNGSIVDVVYKNTHYSGCPLIHMSPSKSGNNIDLYGSDSNGTFNFNLYSNGYGLNGETYISDRWLDVSLSPTSSTFNF